jgi:hypothetical protein
MHDSYFNEEAASMMESHDFLFNADGWPWAADHMGPPCGPSDGWAILGGRLYCSIFRRYQDDFNSKQEEGIRLADARWIEFYGTLTAGPQNNGCYAWNWQECFARSIPLSAQAPEAPNESPEPSVYETPVPSPYSPPDFESDDPQAVWSEPMTAMEGIVTWRWTLRDHASDNPRLLVEVSATETYRDEYIAFGVAEQLMQGPLVACSDHSEAVCKTLVGDGMGTTRPETDPVDVELISSARNATHLTVQFAGSLLGFWTAPRLPARVLFARGKVLGDGTPQPHISDALHRQAVTGIDFLSVLSNFDPEDNRPEQDPFAELKPLPDRSLWTAVEGASGHATVLRSDIRVAYELFRYQEEDSAELQPRNIVEIQLQNVGIQEESYIGFGFSEEVSKWPFLASEWCHMYHLTGFLFHSSERIGHYVLNRSSRGRSGCLQAVARSRYQFVASRSVGRWWMARDRPEQQRHALQLHLGRPRFGGCGGAAWHPGTFNDRPFAGYPCARRFAY